jgi:hypothetical protein
MVLESTIQGLGLVKSAVKMVPVVGSNLEAAVDIIVQSCQIAKVRMISFHDARDRTKPCPLLGREDEQVRLEGPE